MSKLFQNLRLELDEDLKEKLEYLVPNYASHRVLRESIDARKRSAVHQIVTVEVFEANESIPEEHHTVEPIEFKGQKPIIVGSGPAGLFAALRLVERGIKCILLERGSPAEKRILSINQHWRYGKLDPDNNVCFGEGGAGLYSDGKLITRIKSEYIPYVLHRLVKFGAPAEIQFLSNPHVGSDRIRRVIPKMREYLLAHGCEIRYNCRVAELLISESSTSLPSLRGVKTATGEEILSDNVILATGHSAEDILFKLHEQNVHMEGKSFALGLRIEHPQKLINQIQYRTFAEHPKLGSANYKLTYNDEKTGLGIYSFCMCPGGYVLSSGTEDEGTVCNGMSNYKRNSPFANAAIVVTVDHEKLFGKELFGGLNFRKKIERESKNSVSKKGSGKEIPVQKVIDFLNAKEGEALPSSTPSGVVPVRLDSLLPKWMTQKIKDALVEFDQKMPGFAGPTAQLHGVESRTSCPVRVTRHPETLESVSHLGLYPCGEGAGYAGGITSAAVDGIKCAEAIVKKVYSRSP